MNDLDYSYRYVTRQSEGYRRAVAAAAKASPYAERCYLPRQRSSLRGAIVCLCVLSAMLFLMLDAGWFDGLYLWLAS